MSIIAQFLTKAGIRLVITGLVITSLSCFPFDRDCNPPPPRETGGILKMLSVPLKDGGRADIRLEKLKRTYTYCPGWFQGAGGQPGGEETQFYLIVEGTVNKPSGKTETFTWIGPYMKHWTSPYFIPQRLVLSGSDVFIEYAAIPTTQNLKCIDLVKRRKYKGPKKWDRKDFHNPLFNYSHTYKWKDEYIWEDVTTAAFDQTTGSGDVISLRAAWDAANDVCYAWSKDCFTNCLEELDGPETIERKFSFQVPFKIEEAAKTLNAHPEIIHSRVGRTALHEVVWSQDPKRPVKEENRAKARKMLTLLFRFNAEVNAIDSMGRTPLHLALELKVVPDIVDELVRRGGRILYPSLEFREAVLAKHPDYAEKGIVAETVINNGWVDDNVYQVWMDDYGSYRKNKSSARKIFMYELGLTERDGLESDASGEISSILLNYIENAGSRVDSETGQKQWLARIAYPGLRDLLSQYHKIKSKPFP